MQLVHIDLAGPLSKTENGNEFIVFIIDAFSNWVEAVPLIKTEASDVATAFISSWVSRFGAPERLISDQGPNVSGELIKAICDILGVKKIRTTPFHPQGNGKVERVIGTVKSLLCASVPELQLEWDAYLPNVLMAYRSAVHNSTSFSPHRILFGREMTLPCDVTLGDIHKCTPNEYANDLKSKLARIEDIEGSKLKLARRWQKAIHSRKVTRQRSFKVGDAVWRVNRASNRKKTPRMGPYHIVEEMSHDVYKIASPSQSSRSQIIAVNGRDLVAIREPARSQTSSSSEDQPYLNSGDSEATDLAEST